MLKEKTSHYAPRRSTRDKRSMTIEIEPIATRKRSGSNVETTLSPIRTSVSLINTYNPSGVTPPPPGTVAAAPNNNGEEGKEVKTRRFASISRASYKELYTEAIANQEGGGVVGEYEGGEGGGLGGQIVQEVAERKEERKEKREREKEREKDKEGSARRRRAHTSRDHASRDHGSRDRSGSTDHGGSGKEGGGHLGGSGKEGSVKQKVQK
eukprot:TRINITY_DN439_c0_g1_i1.p1 TRINITY_DN439_c0_g1~~TRINITY_DN439_c0_g1_i1.p1  ORF type:complete len:210 (+),score=99.14 TRINITY_DN439_c0_g1_i1:353-982(+)